MDNTPTDNKTSSPFSFADFLNFLIAIIWLANGLYCKLLNQVPRHTEITGEILRSPYAREFTIAIGIAEIALAVWILSKWQHRLVTWLQIIIIMVMNLLEFFLVPHLLLFGELNLFLATVLCLVIYLNHYKLPKHGSN